MRHILLYKPLLFIRKIVLILLVTLVSVGVILYFLAHSPLVVKIVAEKFAPDYNLTYSRIYGNAITGLRIDEVAYNHEPLAELLVLNWNPAKLFQKNINVTRLGIKKANVEGIKHFIALFDTNETTPTEEENLSEPFDFTVSVDYVIVDVAPFVEENITFTKTQLIAKKVEYLLDEVHIAFAKVTIDSNLTVLELELKEGVFEIEKSLLSQAKVTLKAQSDIYGKFFYESQIRDNTIGGTLHAMPSPILFEKYEIPIRQEALGKEIIIELNASKERVKASLDIALPQLLLAKKDEFNLDIERLGSIVTYEIDSGVLIAHSKARVKTPYGENIILSNHLRMDEKLRYSGEVSLPKLLVEGVEDKYLNPLSALSINYEGNAHSLNATLSSKMLQGVVHLPNFSQAMVHLESKDPLVLNQFVSLPKELNQTKAMLSVDIPTLYFDANSTYHAIAKITSPTLNIESNVSYKADDLEVISTLEIPTDSPIREYDKELKWQRLSPLTTTLNLRKENLTLHLASEALTVETQYDLNSTEIKGQIALGNEKIDITGSIQEKMNIVMKIASLSQLLQTVSGIYPLDPLPNVTGNADISLDITALKLIELGITSPQIVYQVDKKTKHTINDISFLVSKEAEKILLKPYKLTYGKDKIFSTKPSHLTLREDIMTIEDFWLNDMLEIKGDYNLKLKKGTINTNAEAFKVSQKIVEVTTKIGLITVLDANDTAIEGKITLLGGKIHYDLKQRKFATDSDIIILQELKNKKASPFMDKLSMGVQVTSKKPFVFNQGEVNVQLLPNLGIYKAKNSELMVTGAVELLKGGSYTFQDKRFRLDKSYIYFTGDITKPLLEVSAKYRTSNYVITIKVRGSADNPIINFSSSPYLSEAQILSVILFDSALGADNNSATEMMRMMGGAMAKFALANLGVKLDHLVLGEGNSIEVGKRISNRVTIIYVNDIIPSVKVKYDHNDNTKSVFRVDEASRSYDIVFTKDF